MLPDRSVLIKQKLVENAKAQMRHFEYFLNNLQKRKHLLTFEVSFEIDFFWQLPKRLFHQSEGKQNVGNFKW